LAFKGRPLVEEEKEKKAKRKRERDTPFSSPLYTRLYQ